MAENFPTWAIVLTSVGAVTVVAAVVSAALVAKFGLPCKRRAPAVDAPAPGATKV
jgi:hypothetical protein